MLDPLVPLASGEPKPQLYRSPIMNAPPEYATPFLSSTPKEKWQNRPDAF